MPNWIDLEGLANLRDVGGIPTTDGGVIAENRLLRSDNLQSLTPDDIAALRSRGLTDVIDLRSSVETTGEGPGPITREPGITVHHHSLFIEDDPAPDLSPERSAAGDGPEPVLVHQDRTVQDGTVQDGTGQGGRVEGETPAAALPWIGRPPSASHELADTSYYLSYVVDRPDSILAALREIAGAQGSTLVHCAAGKDRTGTVVALALLVAGADREAVIADYAASSDRVEGIVDRLMNTRTYADNLRGRPLESHLSKPETMRGLIDHLDSEYGGVEGLLATIGWTAEDSTRLRAKLRD